MPRTAACKGDGWGRTSNLGEGWILNSQLTERLIHSWENKNLRQAIPHGHHELPPALTWGSTPACPFTICEHWRPIHTITIWVLHLVSQDSERSIFTYSWWLLGRNQGFIPFSCGRLGTGTHLGYWASVRKMGVSILHESSPGLMPLPSKADAEREAWERNWNLWAEEGDAGRADKEKGCNPGSHSERHWQELNHREMKFGAESHGEWDEQCI